jgi:hypothetical protein
VHSIAKARVFNLRHLAFLAFTMDGPCGVPCHQERCPIFDRGTCKKVGEFITKELIPEAAKHDANAEDFYRERRIDRHGGLRDYKGVGGMGGRMAQAVLAVGPAYRAGL